MAFREPKARSHRYSASYLRHDTCTSGLEILLQPPSGLPKALRVRFNEAQLVEFAAAIARENYRARFNRVFAECPVGFCKRGNLLRLS